MKLKLYALLFATISVIFFSCKSAEKTYRKGNYDEAVALAAKKLSKKPHDASTLEVLQNAYRFAVGDHESRIRNYSNSFDDLKYESIYQEYLGLQSLYEAIRRSPSAYDVVQPTDYSAYVTTYKEEAANARIDRGLSLMDNANTKTAFKDAYYEFQRALALKPGDLSIQQKMDAAYANAVTNVIVMPLTRIGYQYSSYNFDANNFSSDITRYLNNNNNTFTRFYDPLQARGYNLRTDNTVDMQYSDVNIGRYRDQHNTREVTKQIVSKEIVYSKDSVIKEYITVKAKITTTTRTLQADGLLQATVRDYKDRLMWSDTYRGDYSWIATFSTFTGDERALSDEDKKLINQRETWPPSNDEIIRLIMNEIRSKTECGINDYFKRTS